MIRASMSTLREILLKIRLIGMSNALDIAPSDMPCDGTNRMPVLYPRKPGRTLLPRAPSLDPTHPGGQLSEVFYIRFISPI